jgi:hypothetical protein
MYSLDPSLRSFGLGFQNFVTRLCGAVPGPVLFGFFLDRSCSLWDVKCGEQGSCHEYDHESVRDKLILLSLLPKSLAVLCYFIAWMTLKKDQIIPEENNTHAPIH